MSCIHFKFSNTVDEEKIKFDGLHISVADLREAIIKQKSLKSNMHSLKIIDSQTKKEYSDAKEMLPRNTSVIVSRTPLVSSQRVPKSKFRDPTLPQSDAVVSKTKLPLHAIVTKNGDEMLTAEELKKTADLANAMATEEDKVKAMISQSVEGYDPSQYVWTPRNAGGRVGAMPGLRNPPPLHYTCNRCGNPGHWIQFCPTNGDPNFNHYRYKRSMGTPTSQMVSVKEGTLGAMLDRHGQLVARAVDMKAAQDFKKKSKQATPDKPQEVETPSELICAICKELMKDAVIIPCCGESYCYDCIQEYLCENEFTCPACKKENVSPDNLAPNKALRLSAKNFQMKAAEDKSVAMASSTGFVKKTAFVSTVFPPREVATSKIAAPQQEVTPATGVGGGKPGSDSKPTAPPPPPPPVDEVMEEKKEEEKEASKEELLSSSQDSESAERPIVGVGSPRQDTLKVERPDQAKSRSGSPTSGVGSPAIKAPISVGEVKKPSGFGAPSLPSMLTGGGGGVPLTSRLLTAAQSLAPPHGMLGGRPLYPGVLGVPSMLPGQTSLVPTQSKAKYGSSSDPTKLDRLAAELLLTSAVSKKRASPSPPPPLSQEEFYKHQKLLKRFAKTGGRGSSESNSYTSDSYSSSGGSSYSRSRSRSRSPYHRGGGVSSHHVRRHKHERRHEKREKKAKGHEGSRERGRVKGHKESKKEKKRSKHRHSKKKSHESPTRSPDRDTRHHHATSLSPEKKLGIEELAEVANDDAPTTASNTPLSGEGLLANTSLLPPAEVGGVACEEGGTQQELSEGGGAEHLGRSEFSMPAGGGASEVSVLPTKETNGDTTDSTPVAEGVSEGAWSVLGAAETEAAGDSVGGVSTSPNEGTTTGGAQGDEMLEDAVEISINAEEVGELDSTLLGDMPPGTKSPQETKEKGKKEEEEEEESSHYKAKDKDTHPGLSMLSRKDLPAVLDHLEVLGDNLEAIQSVGLELRVPGRKLSHIQQKYPVELMERVVLYWLDSADKEKCTWAYLVSALRKLHKKSPGSRIGRRYQSMASRIGKKYLLPRSSWTGKEEGEISDDSDEGDLRETILNSSQAYSSEPDLRETINSHKSAVSRKRPPPAVVVSHEEGVEKEEEEEEEGGGSDGEDYDQKPAKRRKMPSGRTKSHSAANQRYSSSEGSETEDDSSSSSMESEEEFVTRVKSSKSSRTKHSLLSSKARKHKTSREHRSKKREKEGRREEEREKAGRREKKKAKKEKRRKSRDHKHSKSHKKKSSKVEQREGRRDKKVKKHKKTSRSERDNY